MAVLNPDQRAALVLVDMEGYSVEEAAAILGCAVGTVKSRCARGRARLVPLLSPMSTREWTDSGRSGGGDELMAGNPERVIAPAAVRQRAHSTLSAWILAEAPHAELDPDSRRTVGTVADQGVV